MKKRAVILSVLLVLALTPAFANPATKVDRAESLANGLVSLHWQMNEALYQAGQNPGTAAQETVEKLAKIYDATCTEMSKLLLTCLDPQDRAPLARVSDVYKSHDAVTRMAFYPALQQLRFAVLHSDQPTMTEAEFRDYFPGYGYTEPGYKYRKGREIDRENKGVTWQSEEQTIQSTFNVKLVINIDLLDIFKGMVGGGIIRDLRIGKEFTQHVGGQPMICVEISFQLVKSIVTKTNRKFDVNKVWFELLRAKIGSWGSVGEWEVCGKTYEILHEPTGEAVVTDVKAN